MYTTMAQSTLSFATSAPARSSVPRSLGGSLGTVVAPQRTRQVARASADCVVETPETLEYVEGVERPVGVFIDEKALLAKSKFPLSPEVLVQKTKYALEGLRYAVDDSVIDLENFEFCAPFAGPLKWGPFSRLVKVFDFEGAFDLYPCHYDIRVDPYEPNRVWFTSRTYAKHTGTVMGRPATNKIIDGPPQCSSFAFNEDGKIVEFTMGYVMNRRIGNTGGLGGAYGFLYAIGSPLPFREAKPFQPSWGLWWFKLMGPLTAVVRGDKDS